MEEIVFTEVEIASKEGEIVFKEIKTTCCRSFLTSKGRCFDCVDEKRQMSDQEYDPDEELR